MFCRDATLKLTLCSGIMSTLGFPRTVKRVLPLFVRGTMNTLTSLKYSCDSGVDAKKCCCAGRLAKLPKRGQTRLLSDAYVLLAICFSCEGMANRKQRGLTATDEFPDLSQHKNHMAKFLTQDMYATMKERSTRSGFTIDGIIQTGVDNPGTVSPRLTLTRVATRFF